MNVPSGNTRVGLWRRSWQKSAQKLSCTKAAHLWTKLPGSSDESLAQETNFSGRTTSADPFSKILCFMSLFMSLSLFSRSLWPTFNHHWRHLIFAMFVRTDTTQDKQCTFDLSNLACTNGLASVMYKLHSIIHEHHRGIGHFGRNGTNKLNTQGRQNERGARQRSFFADVCPCSCTTSVQISLKQEQLFKSMLLNFAVFRFLFFGGFFSFFFFKDEAPEWGKVIANVKWKTSFGE